MTEKDIPLSELARLLPDTPSYKTLWRWAKVGVQSMSGRTVTLETIKLPRGLGSSLARFEEFVKELQE